VISVVADSNVIISALHFGGLPRQFLIACQHRRFNLAVSPPLLTEIDRILRDKFGWSEAALQRASTQLRQLANLVHPTQVLDAVPADPDDNRILECAIAAGAATIVTGDKHLLRLGSYEGIRIMRVADLLRALDM
jgi:putative PIN family toxin of toxin-antitoxin system